MLPELNEQQLSELSRMRKTAFRPTAPILLLILVGAAAQMTVPGSGAFFGGLAFILFYRRLAAVAHAPCPRCREPFGTKSKYPVGVGPAKCQNCGLSL